MAKLTFTNDAPTTTGLFLNDILEEATTNLFEAYRFTSEKHARSYWEWAKTGPCGHLNCGALKGAEPVQVGSKWVLMRPISRRRVPKRQPANNKRAF